MSHFTVLVIGAKNQEEVDEKLYKFWELDLSTEEMKEDSRAEFNVECELGDAIEQFEEFKDKAPTMEQIVYAHKNLLKNVKEEFSTSIEPINEERWEEWLKENNLSNSSVKYKWGKDKYSSFSEYMEDYHGYSYDIESTGFGYYSNPNAKWDWYSIGGRWSGFWKLKENADGLMGKKSWTMENEEIPEDRCDIARIGDIDFVGMELDKRIKAENNWVECWEKYPIKINDDGKDENAHHRYWNYNIKQKDNIPELKEKYIDRYCSCSTFAVLKDGEWFEKGSMGWWGMVSDSKDQNDWDKQFNELIKNLDKDTYVALVDCHI